jgi:cell division protease FtsH
MREALRRGGYTIQRPIEDLFPLNRGNLENCIAVLMGGRAAEQLVFDGDISTGAANDLQRATIALEMVTRYGMDEEITVRSVGLIRMRHLWSLSLPQCH